MPLNFQYHHLTLSEMNRLCPPGMFFMMCLSIFSFSSTATPLSIRIGGWAASKFDLGNGLGDIYNKFVKYVHSYSFSTFVTNFFEMTQKLSYVIFGNSGQPPQRTQWSMNHLNPCSLFSQCSFSKEYSILPKHVRRIYFVIFKKCLLHNFWRTWSQQVASSCQLWWSSVRWSSALEERRGQYKVLVLL